MVRIRNLLNYIPTLSLSNKSKIIIGVLLIIPLYFIPWFLSLPVGVLATSLSKILRITFLGRLILRLWQIVIFYFFGLLGLKLILGKFGLDDSMHGNKIYDLFIGVVVGVVSVLIIFLIMLFSGLLKIETYAWHNMSLASFIGVLITYIISNISIGIIEEVPFRGYLVQVLNSSFGKFATVILAGLIFSFWHLILTPLDSMSQLLWLLFELIPLGLLLSWLFIKTKSLTLVVSLHAAYNFAQQALDIYGRFGQNAKWGNLTLIGTSVHGSQILVGNPEGSAGLIQLVSSFLIIIMMAIYVQRYRRNH